jgi:hypothetical protein
MDKAKVVPNDKSIRVKECSMDRDFINHRMHEGLFAFLKLHCKILRFRQGVTMRMYARGHISMDTNCIVFGRANEAGSRSFFSGVVERNLKGQLFLAKDRERRKSEQTVSS